MSSRLACSMACMAAAHAALQAHTRSCGRSVDFAELLVHIKKSHSELLMRLTNSARQEAGLFQNIQTVPLCWNGAESLLAVAAGSRGHLTASPAMVTGAVAEMPSTLPPAVRGIGPHLAPCPRPAKGSWHAATHGAPSRAVRGNVSRAVGVLQLSTIVVQL